MADTNNLQLFLKDVAEAIKVKKEYSEDIKIPAENFDQEILSIETSIDTSDATAISDDIISPKTAYVNGVKIEGNIEHTSLTRESKAFYTRESSEFNLICSLIPDTDKIVTLNYTNWELKVVNRVSKKVESTCNIANLGISKPSVNSESDWCISVSERGMFGDDNSCIIYVGLTNSNSFAVTYNIETNTFGVSLNGSVSVWNMPTTTHINTQSEPRSGKVEFIGTSGKAITLSHDNNNYIRLYNLTFNADGTIDRNCPYYDTSAGQHIGYGRYGFGALTLHNNDAIQYYLTGRNYIFYYVNGDLVKGTNEQNLFVSPSFQKGILGTTLYDIVPNISEKTYSKKERATIPELANYTIWRFLNEYTILASDGSVWNRLNIITIDYETNTISVDNILGYTNDWKLYTDWNNVMQGTGNSVINSCENMMPTDGISKLYRQSINYYNTEDATIYSNNVEKDKIAYGKNGKIIGTMPNNGELTYTPSTTEQTIPAGYTSGGTIAASPVSQEEYDKCVQYTFTIMTGRTIEFLNYIKSSGSQRIDLGIKYTPTTKIVLDIEPVGSRNWQMFMSNGGNNNSHLFALQDCTQNNGGGFDAWLNNETVRLRYNINQRLTVVFDRNKFYIDNTLYKTFNSDTWDIPDNITLFNNSIMSLYNCKVYDNDILIMDLHPAVDTLDNNPALFDIINYNFISNSGTGKFIGG